MENQKIVLVVDEIHLGSYTTLLQSGIILDCNLGQSLGVFLGNLPDFDMDYIINRIQTIFLDGDAIDDMQTTFKKSGTVLALSAAMPGLAGAIFRKNSLHAALRTTTKETISQTSTGGTISVCLKLFNMIAREKGPAILRRGGNFSGNCLHDFFCQRPSLLQNITHFSMEGSSMTVESFLTAISSKQHYHLTITSSQDTIL